MQNDIATMSCPRTSSPSSTSHEPAEGSVVQAAKPSGAPRDFRPLARLRHRPYPRLSGQAVHRAAAVEGTADQTPNQSGGLNELPIRWRPLAGCVR